MGNDNVTKYDAAMKSFLEYHRIEEDFKIKGSLMGDRHFVTDAYDNFKLSLTHLTPEERMKLKKEVVDTKL